MVSCGFPGRTSPVVGTALSISKPKRCLAFRTDSYRASCGTAGFGVTLHPRTCEKDLAKPRFPINGLGSDCQKDTSHLKGLRLGFEDSRV